MRNALTHWFIHSWNWTIIHSLVSKQILLEGGVGLFAAMLAAILQSCVGQLVSITVMSQFLQNFVLCFKVLSECEEVTLVCFDPSFSLLTCVPEVAEIDKGYTKNGTDCNSAGDSSALLLRVWQVGGSSKLNKSGFMFAIVHNVEGEGGQGTLAQRDKLNAVGHSVSLGCDTEDAKRHWLCIIQVGWEHVSRGTHIVLEVNFGELEV